MSRLWLRVERLRPTTCRLLALLAATTLAGCASAPRTDSEAGWSSGRMSVRIAATGSTAARSLGTAFELRGVAEHGELRLNSPLGTRVAEARWSPGEAVLSTSEGKRHFGSLDELSREALGEVLPLAALPDWLAGRPWDGAVHQASADGFEQLGWHIDLSRRNDGWIEARRAAPPVVAVRVKLDPPTP